MSSSPTLVMIDRSGRPPRSSASPTASRSPSASTTRWRRQVTAADPGAPRRSLSSLGVDALAFEHHLTSPQGLGRTPAGGFTVTADGGACCDRVRFTVAIEGDRVDRRRLRRRGLRRGDRRRQRRRLARARPLDSRRGAARRRARSPRSSAGSAPASSTPPSWPRTRCTARSAPRSATAAPRRRPHATAGARSSP